MVGLKPTLNSLTVVVVVCCHKKNQKGSGVSGSTKAPGL